MEFDDGYREGHREGYASACVEAADVIDDVTYRLQRLKDTVRDFLDCSTTSSEYPAALAALRDAIRASEEAVGQRPHDRTLEI